jgi:acyl-CoA oxidase
MAPTPQWVKDLTPAKPTGQKTLEDERNKSNLDVTQLSNFLFGKEQLERKNYIEDLLKKEPVFDKSQNYFDGRIDRFKTALAREKRLFQLEREHKFTEKDQYTANSLIGEPGPYGLHKTMFLVCAPLSQRLS